MKSIIFVILSISGIYAQHSITEEYLLNDCLKKFPAELEKCATDAFKHWNIASIPTHGPQHEQAVCCTNWEVYDCLAKVFLTNTHNQRIDISINSFSFLQTAETKCSATEKKSFEDFVKKDQESMEQELCKSFKRDDKKCTPK